jgi:hypothetical protein
MARRWSMDIAGQMRGHIEFDALRGVTVIDMLRDTKARFYQ